MIRRMILVAVSSAVLGVAGSHLVQTLGQSGAAPAAPSPSIAEAAPRDVPESRGQVQLSFAPVVKAVAPSVVNVYATTITEQAASPFANDPFFQRFFGGDSPFFQQRPRESQSLGSGVIVDPAGVVLTNSHVVNGATDIRISLADGREFAVDLVLDDPKTDLAVLRIRDAGGASFAAVGFGNSDALEVGDLVLAIGNPFGVGQTVTSGIVSALARTGVESSNYEFFIQTDAAINPGNSGGALVDLDGRLVGINTAIFTRGGGSIGIGFAIPANLAKVVAEAGIAGGSIVRPWFGARLQEVTADIANGLGLKRPRGALITEIAPGSSADRAGFRPGDVILSADGFAVDRPSAFDFRLATKAIGSAVEIVYFRNGAEATVSLALEPPPAADLSSLDGNSRFAGTTVETITAPVAQEFGLGYNARGVVVRKVEEGSPADLMGLRVGDIILNLNGRDIVTAADFRSIADARPESWQVVLQRGGRVFRSFISG